MSQKPYQPKQEPFPVVFVRDEGTWFKGGNKAQVGLMHVERLGDIPHPEDTVYLGDKILCIGQRMIHCKKAEPNEPAIIEFVEVFVA